MNTITMTHTLTDVTAAGTTIHRAPVTRWALTADRVVASLDIIARTAIVGAQGDRRDIAILLAHLTAMSLDLDVDEDDQRLEWMIGYNDSVRGVPAETILDHCVNSLAPYPAA